MRHLATAFLHNSYLFEHVAPSAKDFAFLNNDGLIVASDTLIHHCSTFLLSKPVHQALILCPLIAERVRDVLNASVPASATGAALVLAILFFIEMGDTLGPYLGGTVGVTVCRSC